MVGFLLGFAISQIPTLGPENSSPVSLVRSPMHGRVYVHSGERALWCHFFHIPGVSGCGPPDVCRQWAARCTRAAQQLIWGFPEMGVPQNGWFIISKGKSLSGNLHLLHEILGHEGGSKTFMSPYWGLSGIAGDIKIAGLSGILGRPMFWNNFMYFRFRVEFITKMRFVQLT